MEPRLSLGKKEKFSSVKLFFLFLVLFFCRLLLTALVFWNLPRTSGFRAINVKKGEVEWGIVVKKEWQRSGLCSEAFEAALRYIRSDENDDKFKGIVSLRASTLPSNTPMINFFTKRGLKLRGTHFDDDDDQHDDKKQHQQRRGYKPPPLLEWQDYVMPII